VALKIHQPAVEKQVAAPGCRQFGGSESLFQQLVKKAHPGESFAGLFYMANTLGQGRDLMGIQGIIRRTLGAIRFFRTARPLAAFSKREVVSQPRLISFTENEKAFLKICARFTGPQADYSNGLPQKELFTKTLENVSFLGLLAPLPQAESG
jgi:hypothetical protein